VPGFKMPVRVAIKDSAYQFIYPVDNQVKTMKLPKNSGIAFKVDRNFYVLTGKLP
jgi:hypothetical protein